jgi:hypothetical protein
VAFAAVQAPARYKTGSKMVWFDGCAPHKAHGLWGAHGPAPRIASKAKRKNKHLLTHTERP